MKTIMDYVQEDLSYTIGALLKLYAFQEGSEQNSKATYIKNGIGFNAVDAPFCSSLVEQFRSKGFLTILQLEALRKILPKYSEQVGEEVLPIMSKPLIKQDSSKQIKKAGLVQERIVISFPYNPETILKVKTLSGRKWDNERKQWTAPLSIESVEALISWDFELGDKLKAWADERNKPVAIKAIDIIPGLKLGLFPFQKDGVNFIESRKGRVLVGDEMGLGKTVQALAWLQLHPELRPAIIVCPASLKLNWEKEAAAWMQNPRTQVLQSKRPSSIVISGDIFIINYDILSAWVPILKKLNLKVLVGDEVHAVKDRKTQHTKAMKALAKDIPHIIMLSGTPIVNRPVEMFEVINMVDPALFPSFFTYGQRYCGASLARWGWDFSGATNVEELHQKLSGVMIRRKKKDVVEDLPSKVRSIIPLEIENRTDYDEASDDIIKWIRKNLGAVQAEKASQAEVLVSIEKLKQLSVKGKMDACVSWIEDFLESGEKLIAFATHKVTIDILMSKFGKIAVKVDGSVSLKERHTAVNAFQNNDNVRLFVGNIKAAGVGLTLTAASNVVFLELGWTPGDHVQAEDRAHRIGQKDVVNIWYLIAKQTIEESIMNLLEKKSIVLNQVLDGEKAEETSGLFSELVMLLSSS